MTARILVTGATGTVGGATLRALKSDAEARRLELLGAARSEKGMSRLRDKGFTPVAFDFDEPATMRAALSGVDAVFLLTGYSVDMLVHSKRLLDAAKAEGVRHIVHLGALAPEDTPFAHFAWHQLVERAIQAMGFSWTHLRPNFFMDTVWNGFVHRPDRVVHFVGGQRVSWIASDDMAAVAAAVLREPARHAEKIYPLASESLTLAEIADILSQVTGKPVDYRSRPASDLLPILQRQGAEPLYAAGLADGLAAIERGEMPIACESFDTVETITGRKAVGWREFAEARKHHIA
ncbi:MAG: NmrA family NAD(P)-binding protein [Rhizobiaceae bacterium]|nr:NmrA family NAD(P)-binding protein [Rhizobiaceae bacterium]